MGALTDLAEALLVEAKKMDAYLENQKLPQASFKDYQFNDVPVDVRKARDHAVDTAYGLAELCQPPEEYFFWNIVTRWADLSCIRALYHYKIPQAVPQDGSVLYVDIAKKTGVSEEMVKRLIRQAIGNHIFDEKPRGAVKHTALSRMMASDPGFEDAALMHIEDLAPPGLDFVDAVDKYGEPREGNATAFSYHNSPGERQSIFEIFAKQPKRGRRFGSAMRYLTSGGSWHLRHLMSVFDWTKVDQPDMTVVDVGGGHGQISYYLADHTKNTRFIVQDLPHVIAEGKNGGPTEPDSRVEFMAQNFLEPQTIKPAVDIFLMRWILHNWSDEYAVKILRNLIPSLKKGSKILVMEYVLGDGAVTEQSQRMGRTMDIIMAVGFAGKERTESEYRGLFEAADSRFQFEGSVRKEDSALSLITATWTG